MAKLATQAAKTLKKVEESVEKTASKAIKSAKDAAKSVGAKVAGDKRVYYFGGGKADGSAKLRNTLGGKGANLAEMSRLGFNVPPGFTITTDVCNYFYDNGKKYPPELQGQMEAAIRKIEKETGKTFGDVKNPLLLAVRSGARDSMPGMMDTILNLGLNDSTVEGLKALTGDGRFAYDCYRRFIQMYGDVVMVVQKKHENDDEPFEAVMHHLKEEAGVTEDVDMTEAHLVDLVKRFKKLIKDFTGKQFPQDPMQQLQGAVGAVFGSWMNERAILYRNKYRIPAEWGTAVNVQAMVFGNMGEDSATGVAFTRDPASGENVFYGEYLVNAQGEDVVAGVRTPLPVQEMAKDKIIGKAYKELEDVRKQLEKSFGDVQDFEFTIEKKKLYLLQTRNGKRTAIAYFRIAHDMVKAKLMNPEHAIRSADPEAVDQLLTPIFDRKAYGEAQKSGAYLTKGLPAGPGAATGQVVFTADKAEELASKGLPVVLARVETSPEDLRGMIAANGILTSRGGVSSHAALVARQMGKVCVAGAGEIVISYKDGTLKCNGKTLREGDFISIDGTTGDVFEGKIATAPSELKQVLIDGTMKPSESKVFQYYDFVMKLADKYRTLGLRTNADTPEQVKNAIAFGATGVGLCRTEHMFFEGDRIDAVREMILAENEEDRKKAISKLLPYQRDDFAGIFKALNGLPACIRLLDPPLHEFVPHDAKAQEDLARKLGVPAQKVKDRVDSLHEFNPMLGHRGCRLALTYPALTEMQARAIFEAAAQVQKKGTKVVAEVMVPLVGFKQELDNQAEIIHRVAKEVQKETGQKIKYQVGTMIEIPRGALTADQIAETAEFFSFGTNDLTQTGLGMSRDDSGTFLPHYQQLGIVKANPFASIDTTGIGQLMEIGVEKGRKTRPGMKMGICGEHGGDPSSIKFCHDIGLNYVSCSPFRVPVARLAAARAALGR